MAFPLVILLRKKIEKGNITILPNAFVRKMLNLVICSQNEQIAGLPRCTGGSPYTRSNNVQAG